jgi:hypothetical protein
MFFFYLYQKKHMKKIYSISTFICAMLIAYNAKAQWTQIGFMAITPDTATNVTRFEGFGSNLYAASNKGIFKSTDDGTSWTGISWAATVTQTLNMLSVYEESTSVIYAGSDKWLFKSTNAGSSWTKLTLPMDSVNVTDIKRSGLNMLVSVNKNFAKGAVFYSIDNGNSWLTATGIPSVNPMQDLHVEGDTVYVAGKGGIYKSQDKGATFTFLANGTGTGLRTILRHQGKLFAGDGGGTGVYVSTNNGGSFSAANSGVFSGFCQVFSMTQSPTMVLAAVDGGTSCVGGNPIKNSTDGGSVWNGFISGLPSGFFPSVGTNGSNSSFFTGKGKLNFRIGAPAGIRTVAMNSELTTYFNSNSDLVLDINNQTNIAINIFSLDGRKVYNGETSESHTVITDLRSIPQGIYMVCLSSGQKIITKKVVKSE